MCNSMLTGELEVPPISPCTLLSQYSSPLQNREDREVVGEAETRCKEKGILVAQICGPRCDTVDLSVDVLRPEEERAYA